MLRDIRYGVRSLLASPGFLSVALLTIALGIGASTAMFGVLHAVLLRPLPYRDAGGLVKISTTYGVLPGVRGLVSAPDFKSIKAANDAFEEMALSRFWLAELTGLGAPQALRAARVSGNFFALLGVPAYFGRTFSIDEDQTAKDQAVVLSFGFWRQRLGSDPNVVGRDVKLDGSVYSVIGVMPPDFELLEGGEAWVTLSTAPNQLQVRGQRDGGAYARLRPGISERETQSRLNVIAANLAREFPQSNDSVGFAVRPLREVILGRFRPTLLLLFGAVSFVLLVACSNVAHLVLARNASKVREFALRIALGASRFQVMRQLIVESLVLGLTGGTLGLVLGELGMRLARLTVPAETPRLTSAGINAAVVGFAIIASVISALLFSVLPAIEVLRSDPNGFLKGSAGLRSAAPLFRRDQRRAVLLIIEVAVCTLLSIGAGLMVRSVGRLFEENLGFSSKNILTMEVCLPRFKYAEGKRQADFFQKSLSQVRELGEVNGVALSTSVPLSGSYATATVSVEGQPGPAEQEVNLQIVSSGLFSLLQIPLLQGRDFTDRDRTGQQHVAIVDQAMARRFWPNGNGIGKRIRGPWANDDQWTEIVGVVQDTRSRKIEAAPSPTIYLPFLQTPNPCMYVLAGGASNSSSLAARISGQIWLVDKDQPISKIRTIEQLFSMSLAEPRLIRSLLSVFAGLALVVAAVGIYGVVSYWVAGSAREIAIRMALGGARWDILRHFVGGTMSILAIGLIAGVVAAALLTPLLSRYLYGVAPHDPVTSLGSALVVAGAGALASYIAARMAIAIDPMVALRDQ